MHISRVFMSAALAVLLFSLSMSASAASAGAIKVTSIAQLEVETVGANGKKHLERVPVEKAIPGTVVLFSNTFENISKKSAGDIVINNPVPANTEYQAGSAYGENTEITFSVDGGKSFAVAEKLKIKNADGQDQIAKAANYTNIRWTHKGQLAPGATGEVGFRAAIK